MDISVIQAKPEDSINIDQYLSAKPLASPYQHMHWLIAVKRAYRFDYSYLLAKVENKLVGILPVCMFKGLGGKINICSLPFCDVGGVIADSSEIKDALIQQALKLVDQQQAAFLEIRQRLTDQEVKADMTDQKVSMLLDLPDTADSLFDSLKSKVRSQIRKAEKNGLDFNYTNDAKSIEDFYYVFSRNMHNLGSPTHSKKWFYSLRESYGENLLVGRVWFEDKIVGAGILLFSGNNVSIPWASTLREYNRLAPNMLLYWNLLRISCERGCKQFDFGRSTFGEGTFKFKQQWGAKPVLLEWQILDNKGAMAAMNTGKSRTRELVETVWKKLPLPIANTLGPRLRRHISL
ncbi:MAG: FemAB family PEP-CTERM system-associated protein [Gammaproteobacteria bacterium]|nr:FemAB family PEP-CTERM system-associated protein [Gammaproteobacteria bacterium]